MTSVYANERWIRERPAAMADAMSLAGCLIAAIARRLKRHHTVRFLERASRHELNDLGLGRTEALWLTEHGGFCPKEICHGCA